MDFETKLTVNGLQVVRDLLWGAWLAAGLLFILYRDTVCLKFMHDKGPRMAWTNQSEAYRHIDVTIRIRQCRYVSEFVVQWDIWMYSLAFMGSCSMGCLIISDIQEPGNGTVKRHIFWCFCFPIHYQNTCCLLCESGYYKNNDVFCRCTPNTLPSKKTNRR